MSWNFYTSCSVVGWHPHKPAKWLSDAAFKCAEKCLDDSKIYTFQINGKHFIYQVTVSGHGCNDITIYSRKR